MSRQIVAPQSSLKRWTIEREFAIDSPLSGVQGTVPRDSVSVPRKDSGRTPILASGKLTRFLGCSQLKRYNCHNENATSDTVLVMSGLSRCELGRDKRGPSRWGTSVAFVIGRLVGLEFLRFLEDYLQASQSPKLLVAKAMNIQPFSALHDSQMRPDEPSEGKNTELPRSERFGRISAWKRLNGLTCIPTLRM